jgi:hypothetical protein
MQVCKPRHYALVEAVEPFKLHPMSMSYIFEVFEHLLRLWMCIWLHTLTVTTTDHFLDFRQLAEMAEILLMQVSKPCRYIMAEAVEPFKLHPMSMSYIYDVFEDLCKLWMGIWLHTHIVTNKDILPDFRHWLKSYLMQVCKPCHYHYTLVEAVEPFKLHPMSISYIYEVFEHLLRLWLGIWLHILIDTSTDTALELWELAEILPDASVQTMTQRFG